MPLPKFTLRTLFLVFALVGLTACGDSAGTTPPVDISAELGLVEGLTAHVVLDGLTNPSGVCFDPDGDLTVCDSGGARVILLEDGHASDHLTGFDTEFWKIDKATGTKRFKLGPLSALYLPDGRLVVSDGGKPDGAERLLFFSGSGTAADGDPTNAVGPTTEDAKDKGEGNLTGMSLSRDGHTIWVAGQGSDAKTWVLACDIATRKLTPWASADDNGITVNSPMDTLVWDASTLLVLYSGAGGKEDGLIVVWDIPTKQPRSSHRLPGLVDPMGFARIPGTDALVVVDNNWALTEVKQGRVARVTLKSDKKGAAQVEILGTNLRGPVACRFGPEGRLHVAQLGKAFDQTEGNVIAIGGIK